MDAILERIAAWESSGLIDADTALRLRIDEEARAASAARGGPQGDPRGPSTISQTLGPAVSIGEMFGYLGGAFLLGAADAFLVRFLASGSDDSVAIGLGLALLAAMLVGIGLFLRGGAARQRRAAGVVFAAAVGHAATAAASLAAAADIEFPLSGVLATGVGAVVAFAIRRQHPALLTQATLLIALTSLAAALLSQLERIVVPQPIFEADGTPEPITSGPDPLLLVAASAAWWLAFALALGIAGLLEARRAGADPASGRRAALTRLWAGLTAVIGLATAVTRSDVLPNGDFGRVLEPWVGSVLLIALAGLLVERAFRRGANTFVYAAALALIIALTDFNFSYLTDSTEVGLLLEGLILLGAGFVADRLRRRIGRRDVPDGEVATAPA